MTANPDSYASSAALDGLDELERWGLLDKAADAAYRGFVGRLYRPLLAQYGFDPRAGVYTSEDAERSQRRAQIVERLASTARDEALRASLLAATRAWMAGDSAALDPAWYDKGLAIWLDTGGQTAAEQRGRWLTPKDAAGKAALAGARTLFAKALASQDPLLRPAALHALADSGNPIIARWLLDDAKDARLRLSERLHLISSIAATRATSELGYGWIHAHLEELLKGGGGIFFAARLPQVFANLCSAQMADAITRDFGPSLAGKTAQLELDRTVERVRDCGVLKTARAGEASAEIALLK